ncbi:50S ribosomal protein L31 [Candidatus Schneideria nysicola]|uniref:50S ribosomal protein L31 n=1 Tax=Candidatus Schneideria nysicola TaxID=1081631 RepID=UPI001CAA6FD5|nr:50S ribosomal protein L31 [Candidatus Schneideria nysicola]UAJ64876.1 50S ribosomal protein L31 [Candidatus Schneideria nysicola]UAJ65409.1 50S ribosomal protein L31 [Candidatus Schneideria nysicola]UAJ65939.1 50S ribosomal protein L31 [Candidatus Schneideria nysicola]
MKKNIHPNYNQVIATCSCGNTIPIFSTLSQNLNLDICNICHPFYTGKQRLVDNKGRVNLFNERFKKIIN